MTVFPLTLGPSLVCWLVCFVLCFVLCKSINELCQQENKLLVGTPMLDNSKGTGKAILDHLFQRLKGYEANTTRLKKAKLLHKHWRQSQSKQTWARKGFPHEGAWRAAGKAWHMVQGHWNRNAVKLILPEGFGEDCPEPSALARSCQWPICSTWAKDA